MFGYFSRLRRTLSQESAGVTRPFEALLLPREDCNTYASSMMRGWRCSWWSQSQVSLVKVPSCWTNNVHLCAEIGSSVGGRPAHNRVERPDLQDLFHLPLSEAARSCDLGTTCFKKLCRARGIQRWPYRKYRTLQNTGHMLANMRMLHGDDERAKQARSSANMLSSLSMTWNKGSRGFEYPNAEVAEACKSLCPVEQSR